MDIRYFSLFLASLGLIFVVQFSLRQRKYWLYTVPVLTYIIHVIIFYTMFTLDAWGVYDVHQYGTQVFTKWSSFLRLHGIFLIDVFMFFMLDYDQKLKRGVAKWLQYLRD